MLGSRILAVGGVVLLVYGVLFFLRPALLGALELAFAGTCAWLRARKAVP